MRVAAVSLIWVAAAHVFAVDVKSRIEAPAGAMVYQLLPKPHKAVAGEGSCALVEEDITVQMVSDAELGTFDYVLDGFPNEGYKLEVATSGITITAASEFGVIRAKQTLAQLVREDGTVECCAIEDFPAFKVRGFMHDVGRSFISFEELKKEVELLARFKVNVFHWHLTDNQGFRFESKCFPKLNARASFTRFAGQFYTQAQCRELEAFARERGMIIVPEIDMPGHSQCFSTAMGFSMSSAQGRVVLKDLLRELSEAFPLAPYIHMGADEAGTTAEFVNEMSGFIKNDLGRKVVVWNKISGVNITTQNLPHVDMTWMWATAGAKVSGMANVDCRYNYVNHFDVFADVVGIYKSNVYYAQYGSPEVAGAITALWNDRKSPTEEDIINQNNLYANALATCERAWMGGGKQYIEKGGTTLPNSGEEYEEFADWERRFLYYKNSWLANEPIPYVKQTHVRWQITDSATFNIPATGAGIYLRHTWGGTVPSLLANPQLGTIAHATTYVYSPVAQTVGAQIEFQNYGRSENDKAPDNGKWDRKGSRVFVNDKEIAPPTWVNAGKGIGPEVDLRNENFCMRKPIAVELKAGWNKVYLYLPYANASGIRLNKWMFTFVFTDLEGCNAVDLVYSPNQLLDEASEQLWSRLDEMEQAISSSAKDQPGYYPASIGTDAQHTIAALRQKVRTATANIDTLREQAEAAFAAFETARAAATIQLPLASNAQEEYWYTLQTPRRQSLYLSATSSDGVVTGVEKAADSSTQWKFCLRNDGTYDIVHSNGSYVSPASSNNTAIRLTTQRPAKGWTFEPASVTGFLIIRSGNVQFNQTNKGDHNAQLFNWGGGTNTTDTGCMFAIAECEIQPAPQEPEYEYIGAIPGKTYTITNIQKDGTTRILYAEGGEMRVSEAGATGETLGSKACFFVEGHEGKVAFKNAATGEYLVWRGKGAGHNGDKGLTATYNPTYCNWTVLASSNKIGAFWFYSKRGNGTAAGSLVLMSAGTFDAYSDSEGWANNYSNVFLFDEVNFHTGIEHLPASSRDDNAYDLFGRPIAPSGKVRGIVIRQGRKVLQ